MQTLLKNIKFILSWNEVVLLQYRSAWFGNGWLTGRSHRMSAFFRKVASPSPTSSEQVECARRE